MNAQEGITDRMEENDVVTSEEKTKAFGNV